MRVEWDGGGGGRPVQAGPWDQEMSSPLQSPRREAICITTEAPRRAEQQVILQPSWTASSVQQQKNAMPDNESFPCAAINP